MASFESGTEDAEHFTKMSQASPTSVPQVHTPSLITRLVELREAADFLARDRARPPAAILEETRHLVELTFNVLPLIHAANHLLLGNLAQAETFALRELAAARRHQELAARSTETCRAACELSLRALIRAIDALLAELIPHSMVPSI